MTWNLKLRFFLAVYLSIVSLRMAALFTLLLALLVIADGFVQRGIAPINPFSRRREGLGVPTTDQLPQTNNPGGSPLATTTAALFSPRLFKLQSTVSLVDSTSESTAYQSSADKPLKLGVLLLNLGGPEKEQDVEGFLYNLFADPDIIRLPPFLSLFQGVIAYIIAKRRAPKSTEAYRSIGGGSPIVKYTQQQADLIRDQLVQRGFDDAKCYFAMRYWNPYTEPVLEEIQNDGINTLVIVPLYPQYSISTSGSSLKLIQDIFYKDAQRWSADKIQHTVIPTWYYRKGYVQAVAKLVVKEINTIEPKALLEHGLDVLFSAHGVPESYVVAGDPYQRHIEECMKLVSTEVIRLLREQVSHGSGSGSSTVLPLNVVQQLLDGFSNTVSTPATARVLIKQQEQGFSFSDSAHANTNANLKFHLSFQSRVGPVEWIKPYTEEAIPNLGDSGVKNMVVVPISFVSEHIETLEEIDIEYRELAEEHGVVNWRRAPALNTDDVFIKDMADMVVDALELPSLVISEAVSMQLADVPMSLTGSDNSAGGSGGGQGSSVVGKASEGGEAGKSIFRFALLGFVATTMLELLNFSPVAYLAGLK